MIGVLRAPQFENTPKCHNCNLKFGVFKRKHHCRGCGRTACQACSSWTAPLPQFGYMEPVRVCQACYEREKKSGHSTSPEPDTITVDPEDLRQETPDVRSASAASEAPSEPAPEPVFQCTCGMPLCICEPEETVPEEVKQQSPEPPILPAAGQAKKSEEPRALLQSSFTGFGGFGGFGGGVSGSGGQTAWDLKAPVAELNNQAREAVKAKDCQGVKQLLESKASAAAVDRNGYTLAHLAAMFNQTQMVELLIQHKADVWVKTPGNESSVDLAPPALANKMKSWQPRPAASDQQ